MITDISLMNKQKYVWQFLMFQMDVTASFLVLFVEKTLINEFHAL